MNITIRLTKVKYEMLKELQKRDKKGLEYFVQVHSRDSYEALGIT